MEETALDIGVMLLEKRGFYQINAALTQALADRDHAYAFLDALEEWYRNMLLLSLPETEDLAEDGARNRLERLVRMKKFRHLVRRDAVYRNVHLIEEARRDLNRNINAGYALKGMVLQMMN